MSAFDDVNMIDRGNVIPDQNETQILYALNRLPTDFSPNLN